MAQIRTASGTVIANSPAEAFGVRSAITQAEFEQLMALVIDEQLGQPAGAFALSNLPRIEQERAGIVTSVVDPELASTTRVENMLVSNLEPGADLRDGGGANGSPILPVVLGVSALVALLAPTLARSAIPVIRSVAPSGARFAIGMLPGWLQTSLVAVGATLGIDLIMDLGPGEIIPGGIQIGGNGNGAMHGVHLPHDLTAHIVGSWVANGVVFYRLSDGRLAVQNKRGRWKVWRPKKPIVIMPTGAVDLRTMLRADAVLNKQAKRLAAMLNRRAPRPRRSKTAANADSVIVMDGKVVTK